MRPRLAAIALAAGIPISATAQIWIGPIQAGINTLREHDLLPLPLQTNPTQPTGGPIPPVKREGDLPRAGPLGPEAGSFHLIHHGGGIEVNGPLIKADGGVEFTDRGYHCWADEVYGDRSTDTYTLKGNVRVLGQDESIYGDLVQVDFTNRRFVADEAESTLKPPLVKGYIRDNLYVKAHHSYGSEQEVWSEHSSITTCSYPKPHYELISESTDLRPGKRVIFRKVRINILGKTILTLPYLSIPLDQRTYNNLPIFGHGQVEGYFMKWRYSTPISRSLEMPLRLDYFTRLGTGLGVGARYSNPVARGFVNLYTIQGPHKEFEVIGSHQQNFGWGTLSLDGSYENQNYLISSSSKIVNTRGTLFVPQGRSSDRLTFMRNSSNSADASSLQETVSLYDVRQWNAKLNSNLQLNWSNNSSSFTGDPDPVHREQLDVNFRAVDDLDKAQARIDYIRSIPIGASSNFFTISDVTPALTLLSDSRRLFGSGFAANFPFQIQTSFGEYGDPLRHGRITRSDFDFNFLNPPSTLTSRHWQLAYQGEFKQDVYSDDTAQYVLRAGTQLTYNFRNKSRWQINYNYLRPEGFTPLQIDRRGREHSFTTDLSVSPFRGFLIGFATGYDFLQVEQHQPTPWQQVGLRASYSLGKNFDVRAISTYDTIRHAYSSTRLDLRWIPGTTYISLGARYDGIRNKWAAANMFVDGLKLGRVRASVLLNYNGYTNHFDAQHYSFIYDLHCAEAVLQIIDNPAGFNGGRQVYFFIRLKALPFDTPFGTGSQGQPIGTGTGRDG